jgi:hypothetical protein
VATAFGDLVRFLSLGEHPAECITFLT